MSVSFEKDLRRFVNRLQKSPHDELVFNPYRYKHCRENLSHYLQKHYELGSRVLLMGEALGFRGGRLTGIPFSSAQLLAHSTHPFWCSLRPSLMCKHDVAEASASIVWGAWKLLRTLRSCGMPFLSIPC